MTTWIFVSPKSFEPWDWRAPDTPGIGGSETMHCELAWRLAERGHRVISYVPLPGRPAVHRGVEWRHVQQVDWAQSGIWVLVRGIECLDYWTPHDGQRAWCVFQDADLLTDWNEDVWDTKVDRVIGLCTTHCEHLKRAHPRFADRVHQSRNGIRGDLIVDIEADGIPEHNPHRLMYASSPDRGLYGLLDAFRLIRFCVPDAELHVCYGFDNMAKLTRASVKYSMQQLVKRTKQPGVIMRGRLGQRDLYREWLKTGLMCAPTNFQETGYITLMEAQALGAIPIVNPLWAAAEYQIAGLALEGDGERDPLTLRRYALGAVFLMQRPDLQHDIRASMMSAARKQFDWSGVTDQYETWAVEDHML